MGACGRLWAPRAAYGRLGVAGGQPPGRAAQRRSKVQLEKTHVPRMVSTDMPQEASVLLRFSFRAQDIEIQRNEIQKYRGAHLAQGRGLRPSLYMSTKPSTFTTARLPPLHLRSAAGDLAVKAVPEHSEMDSRCVSMCPCLKCEMYFEVSAPQGAYSVISFL